MSEITLQMIKVDKASQIKRVLCYWYVFQKVKTQDVNKALTDYEDMVSKK